MTFVNANNKHLVCAQEEEHALELQEMLKTLYEVLHNYRENKFFQERCDGANKIMFYKPS